VWPAVFAGEFAMGLTVGEPVSTALIMAGGNALDAALAGWWFHDRPGRRLELDRAKDVISLLMAEFLVLQPLNAAIGMFALVSTAHFPTVLLPQAAGAWYATSLYAKLLVAPTALAWVCWPRPAGKGRIAEFWFIGFLAVAVGSLAFGRFSIAGLPVARLPIYPLIVWACWRFAPSVPLSVVFTIGIFDIYAAGAGRGVFMSGARVEDRMLALNIFMSFVAGTSLLVASVMAGDRRREAEQAELIAKLKASDAKVSRLEEIVTVCAWTGQVRWNGEWMRMETFLHERFQLNVTHGISEQGVERLLSGVTLPLPSPTAGNSSAG
jgi:integral membrane sensor domain MASE1